MTRMTPHNGVEGFSGEIWLEITNFLSRRDLRALHFVPYIPSRVAGQVLFRRIDLHLVNPSKLNDSPNTEGDATHAQRNADLLVRIINDPQFARLVRSLRIFATHDDSETPITFQAGLAFELNYLTCHA
jgi:hypothetical protein